MAALRERVSKVLSKHNLVLLRHCKTTSAKDASVEADLARMPNDIGKQQCAEARSSWFGEFDVKVAFHSEARRTLDTAKLLLGDSSQSVRFVQLSKMYGTNCPKVEEAFTGGGLGYAPLQSYIDAVGVETLSKYAIDVLLEVLDVVESSSEEALGRDIAVFSHAVYVSAIANALIEGSGDERRPADKELVLNSNVAEVSGFYITTKNVKYLGSTL